MTTSRGATSFDADILIVPERLVEPRQLIDRGLVEPSRLRELHATIEAQLHRYPAIDPPSFRRRLEDVLATPSQS